MKTQQLRQFTDDSEKVTRERDEHPGVEPRAVRKHPASLRRTQQRTSERLPQQVRG